MKKKPFRHEIVESMREIIFGLEDSLVSTLGAITGIAVGAGSTYVVVLSGLVLIAAEGMSMSAGSYLSSKTVADAEEVIHGTEHEEEEQARPVRAALVMGVFYFSGGFIPLAPYFFLDVKQALLPSVALTAVSLFLLGMWTAKYTKRSKWKSGAEMAGVSLAAALVGYLIGRAVANYFGVIVV